MKTTTCFSKIVDIDERVKIIQGGTCFVENTIVLMASGEKKPIQDIKKGESVLSTTPLHGIIESEVYDHWENPADKPIISFNTTNGEIRATYDHKFYTPEGYKELYKIVWGDLEASQRVQLELLCKQYGKDIDIDPSWRKEGCDNEASDNNEQKQENTIQDNEDSSRREVDTCSQGCCDNLAPEPKETRTGGSCERKDVGQSSGELRVGNSLRKHEEGLQNGANASDAGGDEPQGETDRVSGRGDSQRVGRDTQDKQKAVSNKLWGIGRQYKGYTGIQDLEAFTPKQLQIQQPEKTFAISVRNVNYFVGEDNINVSNSAGKTYAILQLLIIIAQQSKANMVISIVSESLPHLKRGAMRDFIKILQEEGIYKEKDHNKTDNYYKIGNSTVEFFSVDQPEKVRGGRRDILFMNECNNINLESYNQLEVRTKRLIFLDYNPEFEFWVHEEVMKHTDAKRIITTYKDNEFLDENIVKSIEKRKPIYDAGGQLVSGNEMWWNVYGLGHTGKLEGVIFQNFEIVDKIDPHAKFQLYGLDFGFSNDPAAMVAIWDNRGEIYLDEMIYDKGLTNVYMEEGHKRSSLVGLFEDLQIEKMGGKEDNSDIIIGDSAEPKSIEEIFRAGYDIRPAKKGQDSIKYGIDLMLSKKIYITKRSTNIINEFRRYSWDKNKDGKTLNKPIKEWDHLCDAARYAMVFRYAGEWNRSNETKARVEHWDLGDRDEVEDVGNPFGYNG